MHCTCNEWMEKEEVGEKKSSFHFNFILSLIFHRRIGWFFLFFFTFYSLSLASVGRQLNYLVLWWLLYHHKNSHTLNLCCQSWVCLCDARAASYAQCSLYLHAVNKSTICFDCICCGLVHSIEAYLPAPNTKLYYTQRCAGTDALGLYVIIIKERDQQYNCWWTL